MLSSDGNENGSKIGRSNWQKKQGRPRCNIIYSFSLFYGLFSELDSLLRMFCFLCFTSAVGNNFYCTGDEPKKQVCKCNTLFCTFLCRCFARLQRETLRNFLATRFMKEVSYICVHVHFFFFTTADSHFGGR